MVKKYLLVCLLAISSVSFIQAGGPDKLIGKNVSVFYPKNYDAKSHQPSFALLKEPITVGDVPGNWI